MQFSLHDGTEYNYIFPFLVDSGLRIESIGRSGESLVISCKSFCILFHFLIFFTEAFYLHSSIS